MHSWVFYYCNVYNYFECILHMTRSYPVSILPEPNIIRANKMSRIMKKPTFCICENKDADQLRGNREADQRLCFHYIDSTIPPTFYIRNFKPLAIFCSCTAWFVSDQVGNQNVGFLMTRHKCKDSNDTDMET